MNSAKLDATRLRWVLDLAGFQFSVSYEPERRNQDADGLSRMPLKFEEYSSDIWQEGVRTNVDCLIASDRGNIHWLNALCAVVEGETHMMASGGTLFLSAKQSWLLLK